ncbi:N-acetylmuramoyl-L-alanine amidase [Secundilactobacillus silagei]|uniref:N-acetylmuramoyl-L-alanine amidase n=1 Tax=Secundilactobacillus silagei TaxID=1293415 RepID=UPI000A53E5A9
MNYVKQHWQQITISLVILLTLGIAVFQTVRQDRLTTPIANINVRTGPNINYQTKAILKKGQAVYIVQKTDNWYKVRYDDHHFGWVASWLINQSSKIKTATNLSEATIVLDPGHGGSDSGALSIDQHHDEKTYTLQLAKKVRNQLTARGAHVIMTRTGNQTVSLGARPEMATDNHADAFISFHFDSSPENNLGSGFTTYYYHANTSLKLARTINQHLTGLPLTNKGVDVGNFEVIRDNLRPALLLEMGYINNAKDFKSIEDPAYQNKGG